MLQWSLLFFVGTVAAGLFGYGGFAPDLADVGKGFFFGFFVLFLATLIAGLVRQEEGI